MRQPLGRVTVRQVQDPIHVTGILAIRKLVLDVPDAIVLDVSQEQLVTDDDAIDIEQKGFHGHLLRLRRLFSLKS